MKKSVSNRIDQLKQTIAPLQRFMQDSTWAQKDADDTGSDFTFGNPNEMPLPGFVQTLKAVAEPQSTDWFAYKQSVPAAQEIISQSLSNKLNSQFLPEDICLTNGAIAALDVTLKTIIDPGDEVIFFTPQWFLYEGMILDAGATPIKQPLKDETYDIDFSALKAAITSKTRAVIINSPHNPTGKIFNKETLNQLAEILTEASQKNGRTVYLISDEAYQKIVFDDQQFTSPVDIYENTFLIYTYGKTLLVPGQRIGYIALPSQMTDREQIREAITTMQIFSGWAYPNALLQYGINHFEQLSINVKELQNKRDKLMEQLGNMGYRTNSPQGTFYLLVKSPIKDDWLFVEKLAALGVYCFPGCCFDLPGYFRISLTANDQMIEDSLAGFKQTIKDC